MKLPLIALLALLPAFAQANPLADELSSKPMALVDGKQCHVRGAVWAGGPRPGVRIALVGADGQEFEATTGNAGIYALTVPFSGEPTVYAERVLDEVQVREEHFDQVRTVEPIVVCSQTITNQLLKDNS